MDYYTYFKMNIYTGDGVKFLNEESDLYSKVRDKFAEIFIFNFPQKIDGAIEEAKNFSIPLIKMVMKLRGMIGMKICQHLQKFFLIYSLNLKVMEKKEEIGGRRSSGEIRLLNLVQQLFLPVQICFNNKRRTQNVLYRT